MAEEEKSDDIAIADEGQAKILGLPKKIFFIVIAVVIALIIAGAAYFLLAGKEEPQGSPPEQAVQSQNSLDDLGDKLVNSSNRSNTDPAQNQANAAVEQKQTEEINNLNAQVFELREQVIQLKEENLILKKQIFDLETQRPQQQSNNNGAKNPYNTEIKDFPPIEPYVPVDKPKPKFG